MKYITSALLLLFFLAPQTLFAQGFLFCQGSNCNFCSLVQTVEAVTDWVLLVSILIAVILLMYAGFRIVGSRGDIGAFDQARTLFTNVVIGIFILLAAGTIVDTLVKSVAGGQFGLWNQPSSCGGAYYAPTPGELAIMLNNHTAVGLPTGTGPDSVIDPNGGVITPTSGTSNASFSFSSALNLQQQGHLSTVLATFQGCMVNRLPDGLYIITSVSDNKIANGSKTWAECAAGGQSAGCAHGVRSCHYGGASCVGQSYALDIRTSNLNTVQEQAVLNAASACGGWGQNEGDHLHVSRGTQCGCN